MATETPSERLDALTADQRREVLLTIITKADAHSRDVPFWLWVILDDYSLAAEAAKEATDAK